MSSLPDIAVSASSPRPASRAGSLLPPLVVPPSSSSHGSSMSAIRSQALSELNALENPNSSLDISIPQHSLPSSAAPSSRMLEVSSGFQSRVQSAPNSARSAVSEQCDSVMDASEELNSQLVQRMSFIQSDLSRKLTQVFVRLSQEKVVDCFWRSLPKFGAGSKPSKHASFQMGGGKTRHSALYDDDFELKFTDNVLQEIQESIEEELSGQFRHYIEGFNQDLDLVRRNAESIKQQAVLAEEQLRKSMQQIEMLKREKMEAENVKADTLRQLAELQSEMREKDIQMDILRDQVARRNKVLEEQRTSFHKEILHTKMQLYEKERMIQSGGNGERGSGEGGGGSEPSAAEMLMRSSSASIPMPSISSFSAPLAAGEDVQRDFEEKMKNHLRELKLSFAREKKMLVKQMDLAVKTRNIKIGDLEETIAKLEDELKLAMRLR